MKERVPGSPKHGEKNQSLKEAIKAFALSAALITGGDERAREMPQPVAPHESTEKTPEKRRAEKIVACLDLNTKEDGLSSFARMNKSMAFFAQESSDTLGSADSRIG